MRQSWLRLLLPAILILALASCVGGGGTSDNPAAGVEPGGPSQDGEILSSDNFDLPTENLTDDNDFDEGDLTGTPDMSLFGGDDSTDEALFGGNTADTALGSDATDSSVDLFNDDATATPAP